MNIPIFITTTLLLQLFCFWVATRSAKKVHTNSDYFLAGRSVSFFPLTMTLLATQIGGGTVLGAAEEAYRLGWQVIFYPLGVALGLAVLAMGIGRRMAQFPVSTIAQLFEVVYKSPTLKKIASLLSILSLFIVLVAQVIATRKFMVSIGVESELFFIVFWMIVILYTVMGGFRAVVATDIVQAAFFLVVFCAAFVYVFVQQPETVYNVVSWVGQKGDPFPSGEVPYFGWMMMPLLFMVIEQDMGQRCFSASSGRVVSWAAGTAAVTVLAICFVPIFFGMAAKVEGMDVPAGASVLVVALKTLTSPTWTAVVTSAILAAVISTADSLLNAISSNITEDFHFASGETMHKVTFSRMTSFGLGGAALSLSYLFDTIVPMMIISYELAVSCLFIPVICALFTKRRETAPALLSVTLGAIGFFLFRWVTVPLPRELATLLLSASGYILGTFVGRAALSEPN